MATLEVKKLQVEYKRVNAGREEQELRIIELQEQIAKIESSIKVSLDRENELLAKIEQMKAQT